jgi:hypothetical protein
MGGQSSRVTMIDENLRSKISKKMVSRLRLLRRLVSALTSNAGQRGFCRVVGAGRCTAAVCLRKRQTLVDT